MREGKHMGIFDSIRNAIWGHGGVTTAPGTVPPGTAVPPVGTVPPGGATTLPGTVPPGGIVPPVGTVPPGTMPPTTLPAVDVNAVLTRLAAQNPQRLDWQHSIVDLLKLLNIDSSFDHRVNLAKELGYTGSQTDSAAMNVWLLRQVMNKLAQSGGKVPDSLLR